MISFRVDDCRIAQFQEATKRATSMTDAATIVMVIPFAISLGLGIPAFLFGGSLIVGWLLLTAILIPLMILALALRKNRDVIAQGYAFEAWIEKDLLMYAASQNTLSVAYGIPDMKNPRHVRNVYLVPLQSSATTCSYDATRRIIRIFGEVFWRQILDFDRDGYGELSTSSMTRVSEVSIPDVFTPDLYEALHGHYGLSS